MSVKGQVEAIIAARKSVQNDLPTILEGLKDQSVPLDERWSLYTDLVQNNIIVQNDGYGDGYLHLLDNNMTQYDDFNNDRHQTVRFIDMYEQIMDADPQWEGTLFKVRENGNVDKWREHVLTTGLASFTYDW